jgi:hypothetical protein
VNPTGYRVQTLGIQLTGEKQLGFSGAYETSTLWTSPVMVAKCGRDNYDSDPNEFRDFEPEVHGYVAKGGWSGHLVKPDTYKRKPAVKRPEAADMRCRSHLHDAATGKRASHCTCGIYSFKTMPDLFDQYHPNRFTHQSSNYIMCVTEVMGWGAIAEYRDGWRMQMARPIGITLITGTSSQEEYTSIFDNSYAGDDNAIGRFIRAGRMIGVTVLAALPIHALVALMSAKFECTVRIAETADELLANPADAG